MSNLKKKLSQWYSNFKHWKNTDWKFFINKELKPFLATDHGKSWMKTEELILGVAFILMILMGIIHCNVVSVVIVAGAIGLTWWNTVKNITDVHKK